MSDTDCTKYWGKRQKDTDAYHLLMYHNLDVAAVGLTMMKEDPALSRILSDFPIFSQNEGLLPFLFALHDVGKYTAAFQEKIQHNVQNGAGHTAPGREILITSLKSGTLASYLPPGKKERRNLFSFLQLCINSITGHHGKPPQEREVYVSSKDQVIAESYIGELVDFFHPLSPPYVMVDLEQGKYLSWVLAGLCVLSDWLASDPAHFPWREEPVPLEQYWSSAKVRAHSLLENTGLLPPEPSKQPATMHSLFGFDPRPLQEEVEQLRARNAELEEQAGSAERLQELLDLRSSYDLQSVSGTIVSGSNDSWSSTVTIDRGSASGVTSGMPVMTSAGVIGQVVSCGPSSSTVRLLSDEGSSISALVQSTRSHGMLTGSATGEVKLELVSSTQDVQVGDSIVTSGLGGVFPKGLPIGEVVSVTNNPGELYLDIVVELYADTGSSEEVLVITSLTEEQRATSEDIAEADSQERGGGERADDAAQSDDDGAE